MISTFFGMDALSSSAAMAAAFIIGLAFGFSLEQAGFGSSRRLAGIFYFQDMTVLKVMFTAVLVAMLGSSTREDWGSSRKSSCSLCQHLRRPDRGRPDFRSGLCHGAWCPGRLLWAWLPAVWTRWSSSPARESGASSSTSSSAF